MTTEFQSGPFLFTPERAIRLNGEDVQRWTLSYGADDLAVRTVPEVATRSEVVDVFLSDLSQFENKARREYGPELIEIVEHGQDEPVGYLRSNGVPEMTPGLIDDRSRFWLRSANRLQSRAININELVGISSRHRAPQYSWIAGLLPEDLLTSDASEWRAPTSWELRHVVGEGSFTGVSGAKAAELVGVMPQNFRKYTASDGSASRQKMSFAMWHLLLHKLGVQAL